MDEREPGRIYGESSGSMEVIDKCSNAGEVMGIEGQGGRATFCWNGWMSLRTKREAPELGTSGFSSTTEDGKMHDDKET